MAQFRCHCSLIYFNEIWGSGRLGLHNLSYKEASQRTVFTLAPCQPRFRTLSSPKLTIFPYRPLLVLNAINPATQCNVILPPSASYAAIHCNGMLPPSAITKGWAKFQGRGPDSGSKVRSGGSVALTLLVAVRPLRGLHQAAITKMSNSLFTKRTSSLTCGLHVRQCPRRIIRITSNPFTVAAAVFIV